MAPGRRNTPSAQRGDVPVATAPVTSRARRSQTREQAPNPATQPHATRRSARAKSVESFQSNVKTVDRPRRRVEAPQEIEQVGRSYDVNSIESFIHSAQAIGPILLKHRSDYSKNYDILA